jgi:hypothetical protein
LAEGESEVAVGQDSAKVVTEVEWGADTEGPVALFLDLDGVVGWTSFIVAPDGWEATPGLVGPRRFSVAHQLPADLRERWTGTPTDPSDVPPGQYRLGAIDLEVFDDIVVYGDGSIERNALPWPRPDVMEGRRP